MLTSLRRFRFTGKKIRTDRKSGFRKKHWKKRKNSVLVKDGIRPSG